MKNILMIVSLGFALAMSVVGQDTTTTARVGQHVTYEVVVDGYPTPTVAWYKNGVPIPGATNTIFEISKVSLSDAGVYMVIATNEVGSANSNLDTFNVLVVKPKVADDSYEVIDPSPVSFWKELRKDFALASLPKCLKISKGGRA